LIAPGASQIVLTTAVGHAGPSRAAIYMASAPLISVLIAIMLLGEPFRPLLLVGTILIVLGAAALARERTRPAGFRVRGIALALVCAVLFATRDNVLRWAERDAHPSPLVVAATSLLAAAALALVYLGAVHRKAPYETLPSAVPAFAPAGLALATGYDTLLAAFNHGRVSLVSPLNATGSLWALIFSVLLIGAAIASAVAQSSPQPSSSQAVR
jgi:drug/metabolite transporter (DMT)-like permease